MNTQLHEQFEFAIELFKETNKVVTNKLQSEDIKIISDPDYDVEIDGEICKKQDITLRLENDDKLHLFNNNNVWVWIENYYMGLDNKFHFEIQTKDDLCEVSFCYEIEPDYMALSKEGFNE